MFAKDHSSTLFLGGERTSGQDVREQNGKFKVIYMFTRDSSYLFIQ
jgi:hypothetical protein